MTDPSSTPRSKQTLNYHGYCTSDRFAVPDADGQSARSADLLRPKTSDGTEEHDAADLEGRIVYTPHLTKELCPPVSSNSNDGIVLVDWYSPKDPANPQNWSSKKRAFVALQIWYALELSTFKSKL